MENYVEISKDICYNFGTKVLSGRMFNKTHSYILEFNHSKIRCCHVKVRCGHSVVQQCFSIPFVENKTPASSIRRVFRERGFKPVRPIVTVPRHMASWQSLRLPSQDDSEIRQMLQCHVSRQFAFSEQGSVFDYQNAGRDEEGYSLIQVCSFSRQKLTPYFEILHQLELDPSLVTLNIQGVLQWMLFEPHQKPLPASFCLLNRDADVFDLSVVHAKRLCFSRSFVSSSLLDQSPCLLLRELKVSLESCRRMGLDIPDRLLYVSGDMSQAERDYLTGQGLEIRPVLEDPESFASQYCQEPLFLACLGLALHPPSPQAVLDLRSGEFKEALAQKRMEREGFRTVVIFCGLGMILWCLGAGFVLGEIRRAQTWKKEWVSVSSVYRDMEQKAGQMWIQERMMAPDGRLRLRELYRLTFSGTVLTEVGCHDASGMSLKGRAKDMESVFALLRSLKSLPDFAKARIDSLTQEKSKESLWPVSFRIFC